MKRKAINSLGELHRSDRKRVLIRDIDASTYPFKEPDSAKKPRWFYGYFLNHYYDGVVCKTREYFAYVHDDGKHWDYVPEFNDVEYSAEMDVWREDDERRTLWEKREKVASFWREIPEKNRGWLEVLWHIPYDSIIAIDSDGDTYARCPHIYMPLIDDRSILYARIKVNEDSILENPNFENRTKFFPKKFPALKRKVG
jgi:hypothetical protein